MTSMLPQNKTFKCCITAGIYVDESTKQFSSLFVLGCSSNSSIFSDIRDLNITILQLHSVALSTFTSHSWQCYVRLIYTHWFHFNSIVTSFLWYHNLIFMLILLIMKCQLHMYMYYKYFRNGHYVSVIRGIPYQQFRVAKHNAERHKNIRVG